MPSVSQTPGEKVAALAAFHLAVKLTDAGRAKLADEIDGRAKFAGTGVSVDGIPALLWVRDRIVSEPSLMFEPAVPGVPSFVERVREAQDAERSGRKGRAA